MTAEGVTIPPIPEAADSDTAAHGVSWLVCVGELVKARLADADDYIARLADSAMEAELRLAAIPKAPEIAEEVRRLSTITAELLLDAAITRLDVKQLRERCDRLEQRLDRLERRGGGR